MRQYGKHSHQIKTKDIVDICNFCMELPLQTTIRRLCSRLRTRRSALIIVTVVSFLYFSYHQVPTSQISNTNGIINSIKNRTVLNITTATTTLPIINPYNYNYTLQPNPCTDEDLLIVVHSAVQVSFLSPSFPYTLSFRPPAISSNI